MGDKGLVQRNSPFVCIEGAVFQQIRPLLFPQEAMVCLIHCSRRGEGEERDGVGWGVGVLSFPLNQHCHAERNSRHVSQRETLREREEREERRCDFQMCESTRVSSCASVFIVSRVKNPILK